MTDAKTLRQAVLDAVEDIAPSHARMAEATLSGMSPLRWRAEWHLAQWLGEHYGLDADRTRAVGLSNLLGLISVRLADNIADGELDASASADAIELVRHLQAGALRLYQPFLARDAEFWDYIEETLREWRAATSSVNTLTHFDSGCLRDPADETTRTLMALGAPLKISARAICRLTAHDEEFPALAALLDHAMLASVLYDHALDWQTDVAAGRYNLFIAAVSPLAQTAEFRAEQAARVAQAWLVSDSANDYFRVVRRELERAQAINARLGVQGLADYLTALRAEVMQTRRTWARAHRAHLQRATYKMFGPLLTGRPARTRGAAPAKGGETSLATHAR